jgi:hypothetical protein
MRAPTDTRSPGPRAPRARAFRALAVVALGALALAACGNADQPHTLDHEPDFADVTRDVIPGGFSSSTAAELHRVRDACSQLVTELGVTHAPPGANVQSNLDRAPGFVDGQCQWLSPSSATPDVTGFLVGIINGGGATFDETSTALTGTQSISGIGDRAMLDPETRTLYVVQNGRLWYLQLIGDETSGAAVLLETTNLARALVRTAAAG